MIFRTCCKSKDVFGIRENAIITLQILSPHQALRFSHRVERETRVTREWLVTKCKGPWEGEKLEVFLLPVFICAQIFIERETSEGSYNSCSIWVGGVDLGQLSQLSANSFLVGIGGDQIHRQFKLSLGPGEIGISHENLDSEKQLYNDQTNQRPPARQAGAYPIVGANRAAVSSWGHRNVGALFRQFCDCLCQNYAPFKFPTNLIPDTSEVGPEVTMRTVLCNKTHRTSCGHTAQNADNV